MCLVVVKSFHIHQFPNVQPRTHLTSFGSSRCVRPSRGRQQRADVGGCWPRFLWRLMIPGSRLHAGRTIDFVPFAEKVRIDQHAIVWTLCMRSLRNRIIKSWRCFVSQINLPRCPSVLSDLRPSKQLQQLLWPLPGRAGCPLHGNLH